MSRNRLNLSATLREILGSNNVYYQPPSKLNYPCIVYQKANYDTEYGNNIIYKKMTHYTVTLIGKNPDNEETIDKLLNIPYCSFDRRFINDNLYHDVFDLYY